jgi:predicted nucleotidyltransferase
MPKIPHSPEEIFTEFTADVKSVFGKDLISIILYGSGAKGDYVFKKSDINFLIVLTQTGMDQIYTSFQLIKKWRKQHVSVPLFLDKAYLDSSLDSFPIEFLNMKEHHKVVFGQDVLAPIKISKKNLRLQCEAQIKGKLLHLREEFLQTAGDKKQLRKLLSATVPTFASLFIALLTFKGVEPLKSKAEIILQGAQQFKLDPKVFKRVLDVRDKQEKLSTDDLIQLTQNYIHEIYKLAMIVDKL